MLALRGRYGRGQISSLTAATVIITGIPLLYYAILGKADITWKLAQIASKHAFSFWSIALAIPPLLVPALVAYRTAPDHVPGRGHAGVAARRVRDLPAVRDEPRRHAAARLPGHHAPAVGARRRGLLQMLGWSRMRRRVLIGAALVALFTIPATLKELSIAHTLAAPTPGNANFITRGERERAELPGPRQGARAAC